MRRQPDWPFSVLPLSTVTAASGFTRSSRVLVGLEQDLPVCQRHAATVAKQLPHVTPRSRASGQPAPAFLQIEQRHFDPTAISCGVSLDKDVLGIQAAMLPAGPVQATERRGQLLQHAAIELAVEALRRLAGVPLLQADEALQGFGHQQRTPLARSEE